MKRFVNNRIAIIGIAVLVFLSAASTASGQSASDKKKAESLYKIGEENYKKKDYDQAITEYTEAVRLNPNYTDAFYRRGRAYYEKSDFDRAIEDLGKVIQLDPKHAGAYNLRAWIYAYHLKRDFNRAISDANEAVKLNPKSAGYLDTRGWAYLGNGDYDKAIADFERVLQSTDSKSSKDGLAQARQAKIVPVLVKDEDFDVKQNKDNTITITGYKGTAKNIIIPETLYGLKVTVIGNSAFKDKGLISVVIPDTVVSIEDGLEEKDWGGNVIGYIGTFYGNKELIKVTLGKGLKTIGNYAFYSCNLTEIIIPDSVTRIGENAFLSTGLTKVTFGTGLQTIGVNAFYDNQITEVNLPSSLKEIGERAFEKNKIQKITFGTGLQTINIGTFRSNQITELNLPSSLKTIKAGAFANNQIQSLTIPNGVTTIDDFVGRENYYDYIREGAFQGNPITTVVIPASLVKGGISTESGGGLFGKTKVSTITRITIPAGMDERTINITFEESFVNFWINQNRAGGTYVKRGPIWAKE